MWAVTLLLDPPTIATNAPREPLETLEPNIRLPCEPPKARLLLLCDPPNA